MFVWRRFAEVLRRFSPIFRADSFSKIFEKPLQTKLHAANAQLGLRRTNAAMDRRRPPGKRSKKDQQKIVPVDEGITVEEESEEVGSEDEVERNPAGKLLTNIEVHNTLVRLFENERDITMLLYQPRMVSHKTPKAVTADMFFLHAIPVPPTCFRPPQAAGGEINENASNKGLVKILQDCLAIRDHKERHGGKADSMHRLMQAFVTLQEDVNTFIDSSKSPLQGMAARNVENGIKQALEKKEGLFRKNMMGKRVNFAARSVISPDPMIEASEIGVPLVFAMKLTYPEPVTDENYAKLSEFVINGPDQWPGAVSIEMENGTIQKLPGGITDDDKMRRKDMAKLLQTPDPLIGDIRPKKVLRHLMNNDYVLMNRQPTLHKPSIMGHKARVLQKERTIRMHYANCNTYNADFDGDEMNMHLPQNAVAQAEAREIAATNLQYLVGTSGKPLRGLIQDHLVMAVWLTNRDTLFTREQYQQLLYSGLLPEQGNSGSMRVKTIPPAIMKPRQLWTGKQVVTSILENIKPNHFDGLTLFSKAKVPGDRWYEGCEEGEVIFHKGYLACGILDKNQIGPTEFGFVHSVYEVYGPAAAGRLLSILGRLLTKLLHMRAHTCGMDDLRLTPEGNKQRRETLDKSHVVGRELAVEYVGLKEGEFREKELKTRLEEVYRDEDKHRTLDLKANSSTQSFTSRVIRQCLPDGLEKEFPRNSFQAMTVSGAKGSDVNASQISCLLGQQVLEGRRVPVMVSGKTLPCFKPYETDVRAGGYITDRFLTGIRPQEYYFHCMAGREGLIDTAVKTSRSGYLQRCLIKGMEGIKVNYDNTVRDSDGSLIQFLYGEDGLDVAKQRHLNQYKFCAQNMASLLRRATEDYTNADIAPTLGYLATALSYEAKAGNRVKKALKKYHKKKDLGASEVTMSELNPTRFLGSVSERFWESREEYIEKNPDQILNKKPQLMAGRDLVPTLEKGEFRTLMDLKYLRSMIDPGEAVGIVAGQSIGEPSTQMTLNTFHLAGHASKNVTLGIPRLREIVMTASANIGTPTMTLNLRPEVSEQAAEIFVKRCSRLLLAELIDSVSVTEDVTTKSKTYTIRLDLFPADEYAEEYSVSKKQVQGVLKGKFMRALDIAVAKALDPKRAKSKALVGKDDAMPEVGETSGPSEEIQAPREREGDDRDDDNDSDDDDEGDASAAKRRNQKIESTSYEKPDEGEEEIVRMVDNEASQEEDEGLGESMNEASDAENGEPARMSKQENVSSENVTSFEFDSEGQWCEIKLEYPAEAPKVLMLGIVEKVCRDTVIHQLPGITSMSKVPTSELSKEEQAQGKVRTRSSTQLQINC
jgi:DNA-directed RNA polymerase I subunit RPA1